MLAVEFEDLPERLQLALHIAAKQLPTPQGGNTDVVALHEEFQRYYRTRVVIGRKNIAAVLEVSPRTISRYLKDPEFQQIMRRDDKGRWCAFETDLVMWSKSKPSDI